MTNWTSLPLKARIYISTVVLLATPLFLRALIDVVSGSYGNDWVVLAGITLVTVPVFVFLPSVRSLVTIGDAFVISICMMYGTPPAIVANTFFMAFLTLLLRKKLRTAVYRIVFNIATAALNVWLYGLVYYRLNPSGSYYLEDVLLPTFGLALTFFLSNSLFVATAISLSLGENILQVWYSNYRLLFLDFLVSSCAGAFLLLFRAFHEYAPLLMAPFVGAVWGINKVNRAKAIEAEEHLKEQEQLYLRTVESLALAVDAKDQTTYGHIRRVRAYALGLAKVYGVTDTKELMAIETGSLLHDIGKLAIDDYILNKPGRLSKQEFEKMKMHAPAGHEILKQIQFPFPVANYVRHHHERWDGNGYPDGLKGLEIPLGARILSIADAFDAIRSTRPYKLPFSMEDSVELLRSQSGNIYDPKLVELFVQHIDELEALAEEAVKNIPQLSFRDYFEKVDRALSAADSPATLPTLPTAVSAELVALYEFCNSFGKHLDLSDVLAILGRRFKRLLPFSTCIFFLDNGEGALNAVHVLGKFSDVLQNLNIGLGKGVSGWVAAYRRPIMNTGPALEFQDIEGDFTSLTDTLVVPLMFDGNCLGTVSLYAQSPVFYSQANLSLLQLLADQVSPCIAEAFNRHTLSAEQSENVIDPVTQTQRITYLSVAGSHMIDLAAGNRSPLSLLYVEVRNLPQIFRLYGIHSSDAILRKIAEILKRELRETDILVRSGYEGFVALMAGARKEMAARYCERWNKQIRDTIIGTIPGCNIVVTCRIGVASYPEDGSTVFALLDSAQKLIVEQDDLAKQKSGLDDTLRNILEFPPRY
jgi:diguanylate cyclase (GGDEF)-like protein/putative nucleotidyltransferase with HDIG domain